MANGQRRDVKMTLSVETLGEEGIKALQQSIQQLADEGGSAAPEFQKLADEVSRLGQQTQALSAFRDLGEETRVLAERQQQATTAAQQLADRLDEVRAASTGAAEAQQRAAAAVADGQKALNDAGLAIRELRSQYDAAGKNTAEYRVEMQRLLGAQNAAKNALVDLRTEQQAANKALTDAESEQTKVERAYKRTESALAAANTALERNASEVRAAAAAAEALGLATDDIAAAEARLVSEFNAAGAAARTRKQSIDDLVESDRLLAVEERALADLMARGQQALQAEVLAQRDAARSAEGYAQALREAAAAADQRQANDAKWQREAEAIVNAAEAAQRLNRQTEELVATQRELAATAAFEKQAAEARKLLQSADYVRFWTEALEQSEAATRRVQGAFDTLNVRSAEAIEAELRRVRAALGVMGEEAQRTGTSMSGAFAAGEARVQALQRELRELNGTLTASDRLADAFKNSLGQIAVGNLIADAIGALVNKVKELGVAFVTTIAQTEQLRRGLLAVYKDTRVAADQFEFLSTTAIQSGVAMGDIQSAFVKFSASTRAANLPLQETNALFAAVTGAAGSLGLSGEQVNGMLEALAQMAAKGTVSMEELRQQLGDRLPGAFSLVAQGLGVTEAQLIKLVESGSLAARDLFPALTKALSSMQGEVTGLVPTFENLKNVLQQVASSSGDAAWTAVLTAGLKALTALVGIVGGAFLGFSNTLGVAGAAVAGFAAVLTGKAGVKEALEGVKAELDAAAARQAKFSESIDAVLDPTQKAAQAVTTYADVQKAAANSAQALAQVVTTTEAGMAAQKAQADLAAASNGNLAGSYVKLTADLSETIATLEKQSVARDKEAKAIAVEGQAMVQLTGLRQSERDSLEAAATAANNNVTALERAAQSRRAEVEVLQVQQNALLQLAATSETEAKAREQEIAAINRKVEASKAESAQSEAAAVAARNEALVRQVQRQMYEDNSAAVATLERAMIAANTTAEAVGSQMRAGLQTAEQYAAAQRNAAAATALYNDALRDSTEKIKAKSTADQANINVMLAGLNVQQQAYDRLAAAARASGDLAQATYYEIEAKRTQIRITQLTAEAKNLEARATIAAVEAERKELESKGPLTEAKRLELEARLANAKAKQVEAGASADIIRALESEITAIRNNANARTGNRSSLDADTSARYKNRDAIDAQTTALVKQQTTSDGFKANKDGSAAGTFNNNVPLNKIFEVMGNEQNASVEEIRAALEQARNAGQYLDSMTSLSAGSVSGQTRFDIATRQRRLQDLLAEREAAGAQRNPGSVSAPSGGATSQHTVTVNIGGSSRTINTASEADSQALTSMLRQLETAAGRSA